ncbi:MAG: hypothetical protein AB1576_02440 [Bacillota bacterium]
MPDREGDWYGLELYLHAVSAVCSVACLERPGGTVGRPSVPGPRETRLLPPETQAAKEAKER